MKWNIKFGAILIVTILVLIITIHYIYLIFPRSVKFEEVGKIERIEENDWCEVKLLSSEKMRKNFLKYEEEFKDIFSEIGDEYSIAISYRGEIKRLTYNIDIEIFGTESDGIDSFYEGNAKFKDRNSKEIIVYKYKSKEALLNREEIYRSEKYFRSKNHMFGGYLDNE